MVHEDLSDEYVAGILKQDAKASSIKYSALGMQAFLPTRPTNAAPKPNTRFLRNILRETDSHNAALLAKEQREARIRLRASDDAKTALKRSKYVTRDDNRRDRKRRHTEDCDSDRGPSGSPHRERRRRSRRSESSSGRQREPGRLSRYSEDDSREEGKDSERRDYRHRERRRSRKRSGREKDRDHDRRRRRDRKRRDSVSSSRSRSPINNHKPLGNLRRQKNASSQSTPSTHKSTHRSHRSNSQDPSPHPPSPSSDASSDPLEAIVGPLPPPPAPTVRPRGRGALTSNSSAMDHRFTSSYDPTADVQLGSASEDDWDQALEALRDRQKWKQQGAERLKAAGFSEEEVRKWEKGGEKDESDVRWAKKGGGGEWDRGKVVDEDGTVELKPEWGRLKGT